MSACQLETHTHLALVSNLGAKLECQCPSPVGDNTFFTRCWCASVQYCLCSEADSAASAKLLMTQQLTAGNDVTAEMPCGLMQFCH